MSAPSSKTPVAAEIRAHARGLTETKRMAFIRDAINAKDKACVAALLSTPAYLSGLSKEQADLTSKMAEETFAQIESAQLRAAEHRVAEVLARLPTKPGPFARVPNRPALSPPREGTQRARCIALMLRPEGASYDEIVAVVLAHSKECKVAQRVCDIIGLTHKANGYGVRTSDDGERIYAYEQ